MSSVGTQTKPKRFIRNYFKHIVDKLSLNTPKSLTSTTDYQPTNQIEVSIMSRSETSTMTHTISTDTSDWLVPKKVDLNKYLQKLFMIKSRQKRLQEVSSEETNEMETKKFKEMVIQKEIDQEPINKESIDEFSIPTTSYQCCLDVSCVDPPPILPMNLFQIFRDSKKKITPNIKAMASQSDVDRAALYLFAMEMK